MVDHNRLKRVHVINVRYIDGKYFIILSDNSKVQWEQWIKMDENERRNQ